MKTTVASMSDPHTDRDVYIGRPSIWGNPYSVTKKRSRAEAIRMFEEYLLGNTPLLQRVQELKGKRLICYCAPKACHGDVLARLANQNEPT